jgi:UDP-N-acetyl-D-glucosamine dehydrogenase
MGQDQVLINKIKDKSAKIGVLGVGYVGLPFAIEKARVGYTVTGFDRSQERVDSVNAGKSYITDVKSEELKVFVEKALIKTTTDFSALRDMDVIVICVPTPLTTYLTPDLQYIENVAQEIAKHLRPGQLISLESTTYPGTTEEVLLPVLAKSGLKLGEDFFLCHSPERVDPGNARYTTKNTNKVVGGVGEASTRVGEIFYKQTIQHVVAVSDARVAELSKVFENTFRAVNIALVNELAMLCDKMNLNVWSVLDASFTKPFGILPFYPGPGVGGHCIPIDPHYLEWKAREVNFDCKFISLAGQINRQMPHFVVEKLFKILNQNKLAPSTSKVLVLGVAYKKDVPDWRESPGLDIIKILKTFNVQVDYSDPNVPQISLPSGEILKSVDIKKGTLDSYNMCVLVSDHSAFDMELIVNESRKILDTRNALKAFKGAKNIVLL